MKILKQNKNILLAVLSLVASCSPVSGPDKSVAGAILGAGWGAGAGAVIGNQTGVQGPGTAVGAGIGAGSGLLTGIGLDIAEGQQLEADRELDSLKGRVKASERDLLQVQAALDNRLVATVNFESHEQIFFDKDSSKLEAGSLLILEKLASMIRQNPYVAMVEIHGFSEESEDAASRKILSENRARSVATFLIYQGISSDQVKLFAHDNSQPILNDAADMSLNRRAEIWVRR